MSTSRTHSGESIVFMQGAHGNSWLVQAILVLLAAWIAGEVSERARIPPVVGEIAAGVVVGPSLAGLVRPDDSVFLLAELGVLVLLFKVGLESDLRDLARAGATSTAVAFVGVILPFVGSLLAFRLATSSWMEAAFVAAAMAATSVSITARVFSDLKALDSAESATVLGAGVIDDVIGLLLISALAVRVSTGAESGGSAAAFVVVVALVVGFLILSFVGGIALVPRALRWLNRASRLDGVLVVFSSLLLLSFSEAAARSGLAPIIGAFAAGAALSRSRHREAIASSVAPLAHLTAPFFFVHIGTQLEIATLAQPRVLVTATVLTAVAAVGKMASGMAVRSRMADRLTVGLGMIPRGEVGLIVAGLGLAWGALSSFSYNVAVLTIMLTTVFPPFALRARLAGRRPAEGRPEADSHSVIASPERQYLSIEDSVVDLARTPPDGAALAIALEALSALDSRKLGRRLAAWLKTMPAGSLHWDDLARERFFELLSSGSARSLLLLEDTDLISRASPGIAPLIRQLRETSPRDPSERLRLLTSLSGAESSSPPLLLALYLKAISGEAADPQLLVRTARALAPVLGFGASEEERVARLVEAPSLLLDAASHPQGIRESSVIHLAEEISSVELVDDLETVAMALYRPEGVARERMRELADALRKILAEQKEGLLPAPRPLMAKAADVRRRIEGNKEALRLLEATPRRYLAAESAEAIARDLRMLAATRESLGVMLLSDTGGVPAPQAGMAQPIRVAVASMKPFELWRMASTLERLGGDIRSALSAQWDDGHTLHVVRATLPVLPRGRHLEEVLATSPERPSSVTAEPSLRLGFDNASSPWYTLTEVRAPDHPGLLANVCAAFSLAGAVVHSAAVETTERGWASDLFELSSGGSKLSSSTMRFIRDLLKAGASGPRAVAAIRAKARILEAMERSLEPE